TNPWAAAHRCRRRAATRIQWLRCLRRSTCRRRRQRRLRRPRPRNRRRSDAMNPNARLQGLAAACVAIAASISNAQPLGAGAPSLLIGGVGTEEREAMLRDGGEHNLFLAFAEQGTGNYEANLNVQVIDQGGRAVIDTVVNGPWLMAQ